MHRISYVNGRYVPHREATVSIDDRGYHFADGVYEVILLVNGQLVAAQAHFKRLGLSLKALSIHTPAAPPVLSAIIKELARQNRRREGMVYLQITRGVASRNHPFPENVKPSLVVTLSPMRQPTASERANGVRIMLHPEIRWHRRDIKSIALLPAVLAKQKALEQGCKEAWFTVEDRITEGSSSNAFIVSKHGVLLTHPPDHQILKGVTRDSVLALVKRLGFRYEERPFTVKELFSCKEAFFTSTGARITPVVAADNKKIGAGKPGPITLKLLKHYDDYIADFET